MSAEPTQEFRCQTCPIRAKYDANPSSIAGRFWRWHIGFCPGWAKYFASLDEDSKANLRQQYALKN